jgi:hypothetical protein
LSSINPYESPAPSDEIAKPPRRLSPKGRKVVSVGLIYRILGWVGLVATACGTLVYAGFAAMIISRSLENRRLPTGGLGREEFWMPPLALALLLSTSIGLVIIGTRVQQLRFSARLPGLGMACVLMIGFPPFTVIGVHCYHVLLRHFTADEVFAPIAANPVKRVVRPRRQI